MDQATANTTTPETQGTARAHSGVGVVDESLNPPLTAVTTSPASHEAWTTPSTDDNLSNDSLDDDDMLEILDSSDTPPSRIITGTDQGMDDDTVTGNWSLDDEDEEARRSMSRRGLGPGADASVLTLSEQDLEICQRLDQEYERALEERDVSYTARYQSVRQSACFSVSFMCIFLTLGTIFFLRQAEWELSDALLFCIYTVTTVGFGHLEHPETPAFQLYTVFFIFIGIATLTIMVAQVYQWLALEANRAQHERENQAMYRRSQGTLRYRHDAIWSSQHRQEPSPQESPDRTNGSNPRVETDEIDASKATVGIGDIQWQLSTSDRCLAYLDVFRIFLLENEYGRALSVIFPFVGLILVGAVVIGPLEGWTATEAIYFSVVSLTTVGFGDLTPSHPISVWFCVFWLPFSIGFMSFFLANVAAFYIRLSDKNIERIERQLRRQIQRAKVRADKEREEARKRALRGQGLDAEDGQAKSDEGSVGAGRRLRNTANRLRGFDTVPMDEGGPGSPDKEEKSPRESRRLFGTAGSASKRRQRILNNSIYAERDRVDSLPDDDVRSQGTTISTMKDVLLKVHHGMEALGPDSAGKAVVGSQYFSIRSSSAIQDSLRRTSTTRKPSFALRALVQERLAEIIAADIAGYQSSIEIKENTLSVTISRLKETADKWIIPRRARKAFRAVAFEALYFVGEHGLITRGAEALFDLTPFEFHALFAPLLAALGDADTMEAWLAGTAVLAQVDLHKNSQVSGGSDPLRPQEPRRNAGPRTSRAPQRAFEERKTASVIRPFQALAR